VKLAVCPRAEAERELTALDRLGATLLAWGEPAYPAALAEIDDAPPLLAVRGDPGLLARRAVAVVGARTPRPTGGGSPATSRASSGATALPSSPAWRAASTRRRISDRCRPARSRCSAGGIDNIYPPENEELYEAIVAQGAVVAEPALGTVPQARHFPRRNRIISGLSLGIVVVEAAARSGSLITARCALDQGREVFAVPGSPLDPRCRGTNDLIRNGATLTESVDDILPQLPGEIAGLADHRVAAPTTPSWAPAPARRRRGTAGFRPGADRRAAGPDTGRG